MNITEFRQQYPQYGDVPDMELARKLHAKNYSDVEFDDFAEKFGVTARPQASPEMLSQVRQTLAQPTAPEATQPVKIPFEQKQGQVAPDITEKQRTTPGGLVMAPQMPKTASEKFSEIFTDPLTVISKLPGASLVGLNNIKQKMYDVSKQMLESGDYGPTARYGMTPMGGYTMVRPPVSRQQLEKNVKDLKAELDRPESVGAAIVGGITDLPAFAAEMSVGGIGKVKSVGGAIKFAGKMLPLQAGRVQDAVSAQSEKGETPYMAIAKGVGDVYIENLSEVSGAGITKVASKIPFFGKFLGSMKTFAAKKLGLSESEFFKRISTKVGYHGLLEEWGEERIGTVLRALTKVEDYGAGKDAPAHKRVVAGLAQDLTFEQQLIELGVLAPFPIAKALTTSRSTPEVGSEEIVAPGASEEVVQPEVREQIQTPAEAAPEFQAQPEGVSTAEPVETEQMANNMVGLRAKMDVLLGEAEQVQSELDGLDETIDPAERQVVLNRLNVLRHQMDRIDAGIKRIDPDRVAKMDTTALKKLAKRQGVSIPPGATADTIRQLLQGPMDVAKTEKGYVVNTGAGETEVQWSDQTFDTEEAARASIAPEQTEVGGEQPLAQKLAEGQQDVRGKKQKPFKEQLAVGHALPKALGMKESERRTFMKRETGETSMSDMSSQQAQDYIEALRARAREKGLVGAIPPSQRKFRKPIPIAGLVTPQLYKTKILGVEFMVKPATVGKQRFDLEWAKIYKQLDSMEKVINKLGGETIKSRAAAKLKNRPTDSVIKFAELLDTHEEAPESLTKEETEIFNYFRSLSRAIITRENEVRRKLDMEPIQYRQAYMRHIADSIAEGIMTERHPIPEKLKYWMDKKVTEKIRNPMEFQRKLSEEVEDMFSKDLILASKSMVYTGLKEIHLNEPLRFFKIQMGMHADVIPASTRRWVERFVDTMILGKPTEVDQGINEAISEGGIGRVIDKILKPFGRTVSKKPVTNTLGRLGRLQIYGVMGGLRPKQLIRNKFQIIQNLALHPVDAVAKSYFKSSDQLKRLMDESLFLQTYKGFEELDVLSKKKLSRLALGPFQWTAVTNAQRAFKIAYWDTLDLIENPKYKGLGWAAPERKYNEPHEFLYPSEEKRLKEEMEFSAGVTQYHYIPMAMPEAFRYKVATPVTRLQSWWMNYFGKFNREAANRFFKGETRDGIKLPWNRRIGWARYLVLGGLILNTLGYARSYLFGAAPDAMPPLAQLIASLYKLLVSDYEPDRERAKKRMLYALKTFIPGYLSAKDLIAFWEEGDWSDLLFYNKGVFEDEQVSSGSSRSRGRSRRR